MDNFEYKKSLGQNFLKDENIIKKIINVSQIDCDTLVIEIGPGAGSISKNLVMNAGFVLLYEIDSRLDAVINNCLNGYNNYELIIGDFLQQDIANIRMKYNYEKIYVVANLPYYITSPIITKLFKELLPDKMVLMVQDEVADRLSAIPKTRNYGMISALLSSRYNIKKEFKISRKCFIPEPNVDSAIIVLDKHDKYKSINVECLEKILKDAFQFKRKNLKNNLRGYNLVEIEKVLLDNGYKLTDRAEDIPIDVFIKIINNGNI